MSFSRHREAQAEIAPGVSGKENHESSVSFASDGFGYDVDSRTSTSSRQRISR